MERKMMKKKKKKKDPKFCASLERLQLSSLLFGGYFGRIMRESRAISTIYCYF
jgi:hypothetical protein